MYTAGRQAKNLIRSVAAVGAVGATAVFASTITPATQQATACEAGLVNKFKRSIAGVESLESHDTVSRGLEAVQRVTQRNCQAMCATHDRDGGIDARMVYVTTEPGNSFTRMFFPVNPRTRTYDSISNVNNDVTMMWFDEKTNTYVSMRGTARESREQGDGMRIWHHELKHDFPGGPGGPNFKSMVFTPHIIELKSRDFELADEPGRLRPLQLVLCDADLAGREDGSFRRFGKSVSDEAPNKFTGRKPSAMREELRDAIPEPIRRRTNLKARDEKDFGVLNPMRSSRVPGESMDDTELINPALRQSYVRTTDKDREQPPYSPTAHTDRSIFAPKRFSPSDFSMCKPVTSHDKSTRYWCAMKPPQNMIVDTKTGLPLDATARSRRV